MYIHVITITIVDKSLNVIKLNKITHMENNLNFINTVLHDQF